MTTKFKIIGIIVAMLLFSGCHTVKYVEVPQIREKYVVQYKTDSVYLQTHDSIFVRERGDTVFYEKYKMVFRDKISIRTDTLIKIDTITVVKTEVKEVSKQYRVFFWWAGFIVIISLSGILFFYIFKKFYSKRTKDL